MKKTAFAILLVLVIAGAFLAGSWYTKRGIATPVAASARKILYYVDPMHPAYKSDKPGTAPDCGMELVPVYDDGKMGGAGNSAAAPPGTVHVGAEKQQLIGVRVSTVEKESGTRALRLLGRVAPNETRTHRLNAGIDGFIREVSPVTSGDHVKKDQQLATFSAPGSVSTIQMYIQAAAAMDRFRKSVGERSVEAQSGQATLANYQQRVDQLENLGMSALQMEEINRTREVPASIKLLAPADGFVLARNVSPGLKFDRGAELYRIADLSRVWILVDVFENDAQYLQPGKTVTVSLPQQRQTFHATVSKVRPQFDPAARTLKVRLEADNPRDILRPDMFVDIELPVTLPAAVIVPADAVVDSGVKQIVYVEKGDGAFEPRRVEIGWRHGDQVEIVKGLTPGERIAVSGTFLLDSESRMKAVAAGVYGETSEDPNCGMEVDIGKAKAAGRTAAYKGGTYYFCSDECKAAFAKEPAKYLRKVGKDPTTSAGKPLSKIQWEEGGKAKKQESAHLGHAHPPAQPAGSSAHRHP